MVLELVPAGRGASSPRICPRASRERSADRLVLDARLYIEIRNGKLASSEASRLVYLLSTLANLIADSDLETRLEKLEKGRG